MPTKEEEMDLYVKNLQYLSDQVFEAAKLDIEIQKQTKHLCTIHIENLIHNYVTAGSSDPYTQDIMKEQLMKTLVTNKDAPYRKVKSSIKDKINFNNRDDTSEAAITAVGHALLLAAVGVSTVTLANVPGPTSTIGELFDYGNRVKHTFRLFGISAAIVLGAELIMVAQLPQQDLESIRQTVKKAIGNDFSGEPGNMHLNAAMEGYKKNLARKDYKEDRELTPNLRRQKDSRSL